jgi:polyhydroxyalkanoate synthesis regulator phasin
MKEWVRKIEEGTQVALNQFRQAMDSSLQQMKDSGNAHATRSREGIDRFQDQMKKIEENMVTLEEKIREGFTGVKDELGSMIKFSYSDLEKKVAALEARVKALEKMVLP